MQAIQFTAPRQLRQIEIDEPPPPGPGEAMVRTHRMGVCGTDIHAFLGKFPFFAYPRIPGHELGVEVLEVGPGVSGVQPGQRCSVEPYLNCGRCLPCRQGRGNCCERLEVIGVMSDGGLRERFTIRADKLHPSERLGYEQLALVETLAIGCHATSRAVPQSGEHVLIIGTGPIGLATLEFVRLSDVRLTVMDRVAARLAFVKQQYGASHVLEAKEGGDPLEPMREITGGDLYSLVLDATGSPQSMAQALNFAAHGGRIVYVGLTNTELAIHNPTLHRRELALLASRNALPADFTRIIRLIEEGTVDTRPWITHRTPFAGVVDKFAAYTDPAAGVIKAMIDVSGEGSG